MLRKSYPDLQNVAYSYHMMLIHAYFYKVDFMELSYTREAISL